MLAQMFDNGNHMNDWGWGWALIMVVVVVALVGLLVWAIVRATDRNSGDGRPNERAREILAERLARGEITVDQYRELSDQLR